MHRKTVRYDLHCGDNVPPRDFSRNELALDNLLYGISNTGGYIVQETLHQALRDTLKEESDETPRV